MSLKVTALSCCVVSFEFLSLFFLIFFLFFTEFLSLYQVSARAIIGFSTRHNSLLPSSGLGTSRILLNPGGVAVYALMAPRLNSFARVQIAFTQVTKQFR